MADHHQGLAHLDAGRLQVHVLPAQPEHLASAQARRGGDEEGRVEPVALGVGEETLELFAAPHHHVGVPGRPLAGRLSGVGGVGGQQLLPHRRLERLVEDDVDVGHGSHRQPALAVTTPTGQQVGVEQVQMGRVQALER